MIRGAKEIEGFFNLLFAHILSLYPDPAASRERISPILSIISTPSSEFITLKYKLYALFLPFHLSSLPQLASATYSLSNLFNALPRTSSLRFDAYNILLSLTTAHNSVDVLQISKPSVDAWLSEWDISEEQKSTFLKSVADAYAKAGKPYVHEHIYDRAVN